MTYYTIRLVEAGVESISSIVEKDVFLLNVSFRRGVFGELQAIVGDLLRNQTELRSNGILDLA